MSLTSLPEKLSVSDSKAWIQENLCVLCDLDDEGFIQAIHDLKSAIPKKPRASKKTPIEDRIDAPYDEHKCDARVWLKPGNFAGQCTNKKVDGQCFCKRHQNEADKHGGMVRNGIYNKERPTHAYGDIDDELLPWHDVVIEKPPKKGKTSSSSSGSRKTRTCGNCGGVGHDKRTCPHASKSSNTFSVAELQQMLAAASLEETKGSEKVHQTPLDESDSLSCKDGLNCGVKDCPLEHEPEPEPEPEPDLELEEDNSDEESNDADVDCSFEGVPYTRNSEGKVFDDDFDEVGTWDGEKIIFDQFGAKSHKKAVAAL